MGQANQILQYQMEMLTRDHVQDIIFDQLIP